MLNGSRFVSAETKTRVEEAIQALHYRPHGVTVHAGSVILEPVLERADFADLRRDGVWMAKAGFGKLTLRLDHVDEGTDAIFVSVKR